MVIVSHTLEMGGFMSYLKFFFFVAILFSSKSYALLITDTIHFDNKLETHNLFRFDLMEQGFNPATDSISVVTFAFDIKEIIEDPFEDGPDSPDDTREFMIIHDRFLFVRGVFYDVDTGVHAWNLHWVSSGSCLHSEWSDTGEEVCVLQPDVDGRFYSSWEVYTDNLWLNSVSVTIDVTRQDVDEPSSLFLFSSLLFALMFRFRKSFSINKY
jgi:hypothetical protein